MDKILVTNLSTSAMATFLRRDWVTVDGGKVSVPKDMPKVDWKVRIVAGQGTEKWDCYRALLLYVCIPEGIPCSPTRKQMLSL